MDARGLTHIDLPALLASHLHASQLLQAGNSHAQGALSGLHFSRLRGRGMEFDQVRAWQPGDNARHIDWRASARAGKPQIRLFHEERDRPVLILLEQSSAMFFASCGNFKSVQAAWLASLLAWLAYLRHDRVGGLVFAEQPLAHIPPQRQQRGVMELLQASVCANQALSQPGEPLYNPLTRALEHSLPRLKPESLVILLCCEQHLNDDNSGLLVSLLRHYDSLLIPVSDPMEHKLPNQVVISLGQDSQRIRLHPHQQALHQAWHAQAEQQRQLWQQLAARYRAPLLPLSTAHSPLSQWQAWQPEYQS